MSFVANFIVLALVMTVILIKQRIGLIIPDKLILFFHHIQNGFVPLKQ